MEKLVKVCKVETLLGAKLAASAGADFIGLHAIGSGSLEKANRRGSFPAITEYLGLCAPWCKPVIVTRSNDPVFIVEALEVSRSTILQLHAHFPATDVLERISTESVRRGLQAPMVIKTIAIGDQTRDASRAEAAAWEGHTYALLFDTSERGGTGLEFNWEHAAPIVAETKHVITFVAGGLGPDNVQKALQATGAAGADAQTKLETKGEAGLHFKLVDQIIPFVASVKGRDSKRVWQTYVARRREPKVLFSPSEMSVEAATTTLGALTHSTVDGIQIDIADGSARVAPWPTSATEWADLVRRCLPEAPLWIHAFSRDLQWIAEQAHEVKRRNPHLVGLLAQPGLDLRAGHHFCMDLQRAIDLPVVFSVTVGEVEREAAVAVEIARAWRPWQLTCPTALENRLERLVRAITLLRKAPIQLHLDRGVDLDLIERLSVRPDGVTMGRSAVTPESFGRALCLLQN